MTSGIYNLTFKNTIQRASEFP